jgi:hypothetical protein
MNAPPKVAGVWVTDEMLGFRLEDGRSLTVPLAFYPSLELATPKERSHFEINSSSVYWPDLDVDIGVDGLLAGAREHPFYVKRALARAIKAGRLPESALKEFESANLA